MRQVARFRSYGSYTEAFSDYARMLSSSPRYAATVRSATTAESFASGMQRAGYATDPQYASKLARTINHTLALQRALGHGMAGIARVADAALAGDVDPLGQDDRRRRTAGCLQYIGHGAVAAQVGQPHDLRRGHADVSFPIPLQGLARRDPRLRTTGHVELEHVHGRKRNPSRMPCARDSPSRAGRAWRRRRPRGSDGRSRSASLNGKNPAAGCAQPDGSLQNRTNVRSHRLPCPSFRRTVRRPSRAPGRCRRA